MKRIALVTLALVALPLFVAGCTSNRDPWEELHRAEATKRCTAAGHVPETDAFDQCFEATLTKLKDYR